MRFRPCDTCRTRKVRCVKDDSSDRCVLCTFYDRPCTYLQGPYPRRRPQVSGSRNPRNRDNHQNAESQDCQGKDDGYDGMVDCEPGQEQPCPPLLDEAAPPPSSSRHPSSPEVLQSIAEQEGPMRTREFQPDILRDTLGLDLSTHAEYIGPTDLRDPVLLDLCHLQRSQDPSDLLSGATGQPRSVDQSTLFMVHSDDHVESEAQRVDELDAIEALVRPLGSALVDLYFRVVHPNFPILHKAVFQEKYRDSHRHFDPPLLAAVYLAALDWWSFDSRLARFKPETLPDVAALEKLALRTLTGAIRRPKLSTIEAGLLLLQRNRLSVGHDDQSVSSRRFLVAQLIIIGQDLGLQRDCSAWSLPEWEFGLRRRLAWALRVQDCWTALIHGRPRLIRNGDWDVQRCSDSDFPELASEHGQSQANRAISAVEVGWNIFLHGIELAEIVSDIINLSSSMIRLQREAQGSDCVSVIGVESAKPIVLRLREWRAQLPDSMKLQTVSRRLPSAIGSLHLAHAAAEIALHRALIRLLTPQTIPSLCEAIRNAAFNKLDAAVSLINSLDSEHMAGFWGSAAAYQCASIGILAALLWATAVTSNEMERCVSRLEDLKWALRVRSNAAPFARDALQIIEHQLGFVRVLPPDDMQE